MKSGGMLLTFAALFAVVIMLVFGGMFLAGIAGEAAGEDVAGTAYEEVSGMVGSLYDIFQNALPVFVWLLVVAALAMAAYFLLKYKR